MCDDFSDFDSLIGKTIKDIVHRRWETVFYWTDGTETHFVSGLDREVRIDENPRPPYDRNFGDNKVCECGHPYYRHFDTYDEMRPVGCKYCWPEHCLEFKELASGACSNCRGTGLVAIDGQGEHGAESMSKARSCRKCNGTGKEPKEC